MAKLSFTRFCRIFVSILLVVIIISIGKAGECGRISLNYKFERPTIKTILIDGQVFDRVVLPGAPNSGAIGHPALPGKGARILLPYGEEIAGIEVTAGERIGITTGQLIEPVGQPFPLTTSPDELPPVYLDDAVYAMTSPVPPERFVSIGRQTFRGFQILILQLNPVGYIPATGELFYCPEITVTVTTIASAKLRAPLRRNPVDYAEVSAWVDNPAELSTYAGAGRMGSDSYDMLIITTSSFVDAFQPLKEYHDTTGVLTEIRTLADIGSSNPHTIRDYIRQEFQDNGIQYVLIGADDEIIPALDLYVKTWERDDAPIEYSMPGDFYFACLDGTFNYDGDGLWGEPTDGEGGGDIDLFSDVHVGRVSAGTVGEVENLVNKTLSYAASQSPALSKVVLVGEQLTFGGRGEYGGYAMDEMVDYSDAHGFMTYAFPAAIYDIDKLYDYTLLPNNYWPASEILNRINSGVHIVDHLGHSGGNYAMRTDTDMLELYLTNTDYCFIYAEGCSAGKFDVMDCWAEYVTVKLPHGAFGCIANSRLGLGSRSTAHPVHVFNREFWDAIYHADEAKPQLGRAISDSRVDHIYHINDPGIRWNFYEINLFGDPALAIKSVRSMAFTYPDGVPEMIAPGNSGSCAVAVTGIGEGVPIPGTGQLHYTIAGGDPVIVTMTELSANNYEAALPALACGETLAFYFSAEEEVRGRIFSPQPDSAFVMRTVNHEVIVFEDDFETDQGWTISGGLWERGIPLGQGGEELQYPVPDPSEGCNGPQVLGYNLSGDYENNLPAVHATSPPIDCSEMADVHLQFCRWLGVEQPIYDEAEVLVSNNGVNWTVIWENYATISDLEWENLAYDISDIADNQSTVYLRWTMGPTDGGLRFIGWNIDDVRLVSYQCIECACPDFCDLNTDQSIDPLDVTLIVQYVYLSQDARAPLPEYCPLGNGDWDGNENIDPLDVAGYVSYVYRQLGDGPVDPCAP